MKRFTSKVAAFKEASSHYPEEEREKEEGFVLVVGSRPHVLEVAGDRDSAIDAAVKILEENDTVVFLSKVLSRIGKARVVRDQLILSRR